MTQTPKKVVVLGFDDAIPSLIEKHIAEGYLPTFKKLFENGVIADNCLVPYPTITPPNWTSIGTGTWPGTHGVTDFWVQSPGSPLTSAGALQAMSSDRCRAEFVWDALDKAGKRCIVLNFPGSWPSHMKNGIMVGGTGLSIGEYRDGMPHNKSLISLCHDQLVSNEIYPGAIHGSFEPACDWTNTSQMGEEPLEMNFELLFSHSRDKVAPATWHLLVTQDGKGSYNRAALYFNKDCRNAFCSLGIGQWSPKIKTNIKMADGSEREVEFRCKLMELSPDAGQFRFLITAMIETSGWSDPPVIAATIISAEGSVAPTAGVLGWAVGWYDVDTYMEINQQHTRWLADAATTLLKGNHWDAFFMHSHPPDWVYHALMTALDPSLNPDQAKIEEAWKVHLAVYQAQDELIARILEVIDKDVLVVLVSDHGATPDGLTFNPYEALGKAGLTVFEEQELSLIETLRKTPLGSKEMKEGDDQVLMKKLERMKGTIDRERLKQVPDFRKSRAIPMRTCYVYVNLKGRDPDGIVDPKDYEKVQQEIIDALYIYVDPRNGKRPVCLALSRNDARIIGLHGEAVGDVVYALNPWFGGQHGPILPTAEWGPASLKALWVMKGPGIKKGHRLKRTVGLPDLVPTICYLLGWPVPADTEGAIVYQALENPHNTSANRQQNSGS